MKKQPFGYILMRGRKYLRTGGWVGDLAFSANKWEAVVHTNRQYAEDTAKHRKAKIFALVITEIPTERSRP